jgi:HEAT repeat protein
VRAAAAVALADVGAHEALASLLVAVEDEDGHVRQMALSALGEIGDPRATPRLERALRDDRPEVRYQAIIAFARVAKDDPAAVAGAVLRALDDDDEAIRYIAMRIAEEQLATRGSLASDAGSDPLRDGRLVARAEELVDGADDALAVVSGLYLARLGRARGRAVALNVIAEIRTTPELEDEQACVELAGELGMREAIPHLERRVWGGRRVIRAVLSWGAGDRASCAWHARIALARMDHPRARSEILADLASWRRETREAAVVAAGRARIREARSVLQTLQNVGGSVDAALVREALVRLAVD